MAAEYGNGISGSQMVLVTSGWCRWWRGAGPARFLYVVAVCEVFRMNMVRKGGAGRPSVNVSDYRKGLMVRYVIGVRVGLASVSAEGHLRKSTRYGRVDVRIDQV